MQRAKPSEKEKYKSERLQVRLTVQEMQVIKEMASKQGKSVSDYVRDRILKRQAE